MSSMVKHLISAAAVILPVFGVAVQSQTPDVTFQRGTGTGQVSPPALSDFRKGDIPAAIQRWKMLSASPNYSFGDYASFLILYPDWPDSDTMRGYAEKAIDLNTYSPHQAVAYFDKLPPMTNAGRAKYASRCPRRAIGHAPKPWQKRLGVVAH